MSYNDPGAPPPPADPGRPPPPSWQPPPQAPPYTPARAYGTPYGYEAYAPPQNDGLAVGALVTAIAAWVVPCFGPIPSIVALVLAASAKRKIDASSGRLTGLGMLTATKWIAWINIGLWVLLIGAFLLAAMLGVANSRSANEFSLG